MNSLNVDNLSLIKNGMRILTDIHFTLDCGDVLAIIGPNGAGKSSLLSEIANFHYNKNPSISLFDEDGTSCNIEHLSRRLAYLEQGYDLDFNLTVWEVVSMGRIPHNTGIKSDERIIRLALHTFDIKNLQDIFYTHLSGGEKQRVQLARAFTQTWSDTISNTDKEESKNVGIQLLDEPVSALDIEHKIKLMEHISHIRHSGSTTAIVLHDLTFAARYSNKLLVLKNGEQIAFGRTESILSEELLEQAFNTKMSILKHPVTNQLLISS